MALACSPTSNSAGHTRLPVEEAPDEHLQALAHLNLADRKHAAAGNESQPVARTKPSR